MHRGRELGKTSQPTTVSPTVAELQECGSTAVVFTVYEDLGHTDTYQTAYAGPDLYEWMLKQVP